MEFAEFYFIRHGQTADNLLGILQGHRDTELDETGCRQAELLGERLHGIRFDAIFSSDLKRAFKTAEIIGQATNVVPIPMKELREWNLGELEGWSWKELREKYPEVVDCFNFESGEIYVPGGESHCAFEARIFKCLEDLGKAWCGKRIVVVSHGGVLRAVFKHIVGPTAAGNMLPVTSNVSLSNAIRYADGRWRLRCWNDVSHLPAVNESLVL